jgi:hypothetical protein
LKKLLLATAAIVLSSPAFAWHEIVIYNKTNATIDLVKFKSPGASNVAPQRFFVKTPEQSFSVFGPLQDDGGPCLRTVIVVLTDKIGEDFRAAAGTQMNVCTEGFISVSYKNVPLGVDTFVVTHGIGTGPAGKPQ